MKTGKIKIENNTKYQVLLISWRNRKKRLGMLVSYGVKIKAVCFWAPTIGLLCFHVFLPIVVNKLHLN